MLYFTFSVVKAYICCSCGELWELGEEVGYCIRAFTYLKISIASARRNMCERLQTTPEALLRQHA